MTDKEKLDAIRAEVQNYIYAAHKAHTNITEGNFAHLLSFIDSLQEEPVSEELEKELPKIWDRETLDEYAYQVAYDLSNDWMKETATWNDVETAVKLGARWQKEKDQKK